MAANRAENHAVRCRVCGLELEGQKELPGHLAGAHGLDPASYRACFPGKAFEVLLDEWDENDVDEGGHPIITHVLVRRFVDRSRTVRPRAACACCLPSAVWGRDWEAE